MTSTFSKALITCITLFAFAIYSPLFAAGKPNILVVWGDDIGIWNISANSRGMMGYKTPNIDRIANEGMGFSDYYGEQSCTAGRSSFITGQSVFRTGLSKVGLPGAKEGMQIEDPTIAVLLKDQGYATGQFGKNHLGDQDEYSDGMVEHDMHIGKFLDKLDEPDIADNTIVFYSTDNGPHMNTWPDAAMTPFRGEKNTNWEGGWRVPAFVRWPGKIKAGSYTNEIVHHMDWLPTLVAIAGKDDIKTDLLDGYTSKAMGRNYKVHLDGYNVLPLLTGKSDTSPRKEVFYFSDDGDLTALRNGDWKVVFMEQRVEATFQAWAEPFIPLRVPLLFNLRRDPFEHAQKTSNTYYDWFLDRPYILMPAQTQVAEFMMTFKDYPPRQTPASFSLDKVMEQLNPNR